MSQQTGANEIITLSDLYPKVENGPDDLQLGVLRLSQNIDIPFPVEPNPQYANWWHSLHEVAHWAVKPDWYNRPEHGTGTIPTYESALAETDEARLGIGGLVRWYRAGNDIIPMMANYNDPTASEETVRAWSILAMAHQAWKHPFHTILDTGQRPAELRVRGDDGWHKTATATVWAPVAPLEPSALSKMVSFGINPLQGQYRPEDDGFEPPHAIADDFRTLHANFEAINRHYSDMPDGESIQAPGADRLRDSYWKLFVEWSRFGDHLSDNRLASMREEFDDIQGQAIDSFSMVWQSARAQFLEGKYARA